MKPVCSGSNTDPSNTSSRSRCRCSAHPFRLCMSVCDMRDLIALLSTQIACTISVACLCLHAAVVNGFEQIKSDLHLPILNTSLHPSIQPASQPSIHTFTCLQRVRQDSLESFTSSAASSHHQFSWRPRRPVSPLLCRRSPAGCA